MASLIQAVFQNLRWNTNKTSLFDFCISPTESFAERRQIMEVGLTILENRAKNHFKVVISDSCSSQTKQKAVLKIFDGKFIFLCYILTFNILKFNNAML